MRIVALSAPDTWQMVHAERRQLADDLASIPIDDWDLPSLCAGWSIHDVLAHLVDTARTGKAAFIWGMIRARGDFDRANEQGIRRCRRESPEATLAEFRTTFALTRNPPANLASRLVEAFVHGEDIRRPLSISGEYPKAGIRAAIEYQLRTPDSIGGSRERASGVRLVDSESGESWGSGDEARGHGIDLLLALTGRALELGTLTGAGAAALGTQGTER